MEKFLRLTLNAIFIISSSEKVKYLLSEINSKNKYTLYAFIRKLLYETNKFHSLFYY